MVTIKDIARETGLSTATVARALGNTGPAGPETRRKVREAAERLGYVASSAARAMRNQSSNMVGLIVPDIVNRFYSQMAKAIGAACEVRELHFLLATTDDDPEIEVRQMRAMVSARAAAVALVPCPGTHREVAELAARQPFAQLVRRSEALKSDWFGFAEDAAIHEATAHLLDLGHRDIALICGGPDFSTGTGRHEGYRRALAERGMACRPGRVRTGPPTLAHGRAGMVDLPPSVTAVITAGTLLTEGAVEVIEGGGHAVPDGLSFVGFGTEPWYRWWRGGMTHILPPVDLLATSCADHLLSRVPPSPAPQDEAGRSVAHDAKVVIGRTTAAPKA